jgi:sensor histidine kinase YesM
MKGWLFIGAICAGILLGILLSLIFPATDVLVFFIACSVCVSGPAFYLFWRHSVRVRPFEHDASVEKVVPHQTNDLFLFNTLQNISVVIQTDIQKADQILEDLSQFLQMLSEMRKHRVAILAQEIRLIEDYLKIEKARLGHRLTVQRNIDPHCLEVKIPCFILLPLIQNCILHGIEKHSEPVTIFITIQREDGVLKVEISDTGCGIGSEKLKTVLKDGPTLSLLAGRLKKEYGKKAHFHIESLAPSGTRVSFKIPAEI